MRPIIEQIDLASRAALVRLGSRIDHEDPEEIGDEWVRQFLLLIRSNRIDLISWLLTDLVWALPELWIDVLVGRVGTCTIMGPSYQAWSKIIRTSRIQLECTYPFLPDILKLDNPHDPIWRFLARIQQIRADLNPEPVVGDSEQFRDLFYDYLAGLDLETVDRSFCPQLYLVWAHQFGLRDLIKIEDIRDWYVSWDLFLDEVADRYTAIHAARIIICAIREIIRSGHEFAIAAIANSSAKDAILCAASLF